MKFKCNRFAVLPMMCTECKQFIVFEPYRSGEKFHNHIGQFIKVKVCRDCLKKFDVGNKE